MLVMGLFKGVLLQYNAVWRHSVLGVSALRWQGCLAGCDWSSWSIADATVEEHHGVTEERSPLHAASFQLVYETR